MTLILTLMACTTTELSEGWQIDRLRVLAVAADPAEPRPGDTVTFRSLVVSPDPVATTIWFACLTSPGEYGCEVDPALLEGLDPETLTPEDIEALYDAGFIGAEPYLPPTWVVPETALDGLSDAERLEGLTALVNVSAIPEGDDLTEEDLELAFKRVPVSEATTPNHNPTHLGVRVDGVDIPEGTTVSLDKGQPYDIELVFDTSSIEEYAFVNGDGVEETRVEEPYFTWFTTDGSFDRTFDLYPYTDVTYYAPEAPVSDSGTVWVVVRDRRGGMDWATLPVRYR